ncbi:MAG: hypothetical protein WCQ50_07160 [Spirochaetota bacterium]
MSETANDVLLRSLPPLRRARQHRFYLGNGDRILDLWQDGGRGILGARHAGLGVSIKAMLDRGLDRALPSIHDARLEKALKSRWPSAFTFRIYRNEDRALCSLARVLGTDAAALCGAGLLGGDPVRDPARETFAEIQGSAASTGDATLLRPFAKWIGGEPTPFPEVAVALLPLPRGSGPGVLAFGSAAAAESAWASDLVPPLMADSAAKALYALSRIEAAPDETAWARFDRACPHLFRRRGPWLFLKMPAQRHSTFFEAALAQGVLVSPDPALPCIVPADFDPGELAGLRDLAL